MSLKQIRVTFKALLWGGRRWCLHWSRRPPTFCVFSAGPRAPQPLRRSGLPGLPMLGVPEGGRHSPRGLRWTQQLALCCPVSVSDVSSPNLHYASFLRLNVIPSGRRLEWTCAAPILCHLVLYFVICEMGQSLPDGSCSGCGLKGYS